eukprot:2947304-Heterocapsa_arctica.AAC.1
MHSKTTRSKAHPLGRKADRSSDLSKWDMKFRPVEITSIVLDVGGMPRPSAVFRQQKFVGGENTVSQS